MVRTVKQPEERRKELLLCGMELFLERGYSGVSISDIVKRAGVATGLFYYYFPSKDIFFQKAIEEYTQGYMQGLSELLGNSNKPMLARINEGLLSIYMVFSQINRSLGDFEVLIEDIHDHISLESVKALTPSAIQLITDGNESGEFNVPNPEAAAHYLLHGLMGVIHMHGHASQEAEMMREGIGDMALLISRTLGMEENLTIDLPFETLFGSAEEK